MQTVFSRFKILVLSYALFSMYLFLNSIPDSLPTVWISSHGNQFDFSEGLSPNWRDAVLGLSCFCPRLDLCPGSHGSLLSLLCFSETHPLVPPEKGAQESLPVWKCLPVHEICCLVQRYRLETFSFRIWDLWLYGLCRLAAESQMWFLAFVVDMFSLSGSSWDLFVPLTLKFPNDVPWNGSVSHLLYWA